MFLASLLIGLLTAYYFGLKAGGTAAGVALGLFLAAAVVPGATILVYGLVALGVAAVCVIGPRVAPPEEENTLRRLGRAFFAQVRSQLRRRS